MAATDLINFLDLSAFSAKCKEIFKVNPGVLTPSTAINEISFSVNPIIPYLCTAFNAFHISILGETDETDPNYICFYGSFHINNGYFISGSGINLGNVNINKLYAFSDASGNLNFKCEAAAYIKNIIIDVCSTKSSTQVAYEKIEINNATLVTTLSYCYLSSDTTDTYKIGKISKIGEGTAVTFLILTGVDTSGNPIYATYPTTSTFATIYNSVLTNGFNSDLSFKYDFTNEVDSSSAAVNIGDLSNKSLILPVPKVLNSIGDGTEWYSRVKVNKGLVVDTDTTNTIPAATTTTLGGIKIGSSASTDNKYWVLLDDNVGYVDLSSLASDIHRFETLPIASTSQGKLYLYIGDTNSSYIHGYYYKSYITNRSLAIAKACSIYSSPIAANYEAYHLAHNECFSDFSGEIGVTITNTSSLSAGDSLLEKALFGLYYKDSSGTQTTLVNDWHYLELQANLGLSLVNNPTYILYANYDLIITLSGGSYNWILWNVLSSEKPISITEINNICV